MSTGNSALAAKRAGYDGDCAIAGEQLICRSDIAGELERLSVQREKSLSSCAAAGYRRLAFGGVKDAVALLYKSNPADAELEDADLFMVSEIKRPKDGSMEIKFFDRLKALEKLEHKNNGDSGALQIYDAINRSAETVGSLSNGD